MVGGRQAKLAQFEGVEQDGAKFKPQKRRSWDEILPWVAPELVEGRAGERRLQPMLPDLGDSCVQSALARTAAEEVAFLCTVCLYIFGVSYDKDFSIPSLSAFASRLLSGHGQHLPERGSWRTSTPLEGAKTQGIDYGKPLARQSSFIKTMVGAYEKCMEEKSTSKKNMVTFNSSVEQFSASSLAIGGSV